MKKRPHVRKVQTWEKADNRFALATMILFTFLFLGGLASWLVGQKPSVAADNSTPAVSDSRQE